jgi:hypothetical protein
VTAADVAQAFSNLADHATTLNTTASTGDDLIASGALSGFTTGEANSAQIVFTSTTPDQNVADLASISRTWTYTPEPNDNGDVQITYTVSDNQGGVSLPAQQQLNLIAVNDAPSITSVSASGDEDSLIAVTLSAVDTIEHDAVSGFTIDLDSVTNGALYLDPAKQIRLTQPQIPASQADQAVVYFQPDQNFNGNASFKYTASDTGIPPATSTPAATMDITVNSVNDLPTAQNHTPKIVEDAVPFKLLPVTFGFADIEDGHQFHGDPAPTGHLSAVKITQLPENGRLTLNGNDITLNTGNDVISYDDINAGRLQFTPLPNENDDLRAHGTPGTPVRHDRL